MNTQLPLSLRALKRSLPALCLIGALSGSLSLPTFADNIPERVITTQGHGEVKVRPDSLSVSVSVETKNASLNAARAENNRKTQAIISAIKGLNIPGLKLETQNISVSPLQDYQNGKLPKTIGYQVHNGLSITVTNAPVDALGEYGSRIVDTALGAGANHAGGLNFYVSNMSTARQQALEAAVQDARANAEAMARAAGVVITGLHSLEGAPQYGVYPRPAMYTMKAARAEADMASVPVETGESTISTDVTARFKF
ncbi:MAG TPA: SIMPL domain-containing protein [Oculatellaceae cyanobacterium]